MLVLPAPVGPVITNSSSGSKSTSSCSRNAVKPSIASLSGRTAHLLEQLVEQPQHPLVRRRTVAALVVTGEQLSRLEALQLAGLAVSGLALIFELDHQRAGQELPDLVRESG